MELNRDKFRKWLEGHRPQQVVGYPGDSKTCPLGRCFGPRFGDLPWPEWVSSFVLFVDWCGRHRITASRALKILDGIEQ